MANRISRRLLAAHVAKELECGNDQIIASLAAFLVTENRIKEAGLIVRDIESALLEQGVAVASVTTASKLTSALSQSIANYIKQQTGATAVQLREKVDSTELGGFKLELPGMTQDSTLRYRLDKLKFMKA